MSKSLIKPAFVSAKGSQHGYNIDCRTSKNEAKPAQAAKLLLADELLLMLCHITANAKYTLRARGPTHQSVVRYIL